MSKQKGRRVGEEEKGKWKRKEKKVGHGGRLGQIGGNEGGGGMRGKERQDGMCGAGGVEE